MKKVLITGTAGFIGYHLTQKMLASGYEVVGVDNVNDYYDVNLKWSRLQLLGIHRANAVKGSLISSGNFHFSYTDIADTEAMMKLFDEHRFDGVIHLAAQAGVRYSLINPAAYIHSNVSGFLSVLEACKVYPVKHLVYASTSSVYGLNTRVPFQVSQHTDHPMSLYAATKKSNELMAHAYSHLYQIPTTGIRFFSVYGPWGRPDMALFIFTKNILEGKPIQVFNHGNMKRDFTYVDDIVNGVMRVLLKPPVAQPNWTDEENPSTSSAPYRLVNIGNNNPVNLMDFIREIEINTGKQAIIKYLPMQPGDVPMNVADVTDLVNEYNYKPSITVKEGVASFVNWYREYYQI
ncbi:MAG: NAD-dependent epimerase [Flavobacteriales bacterium]|nr:NAD-dependent epimerase [Flavobacteriales bacterium]